MLWIEWLMFAAAAYLMVLTPGPNMIYLVSRSICQGKRDGVISLLGVMAGFLTNVLNPNMAVFYLSIFPQFVSPEHGSVFVQSLVLGSTQIVVSFMVNLLIALSAARLAAWFVRNPRWLALQRYFMGFVLAGLAVRMAFEQRKAVGA